MAKMLEISKNKGLMSLCAAQLFSIFNNNLFRTAFVGFTLYRLTQVTLQDRVWFLALGVLAFYIPFFIFTIFAGDVADKCPKDSVIKIAKTAGLVISLLALGAFWLGSQWLLIAALFLMGAESAFFSPAKYSFLPEITTKETLLYGNALFSCATFVAAFFGIVLGGVWHIEKASYLFLPGMAALAFLSSLVLPQAQKADTLHKPDYNIIRSAVSNIRLALHSRDIFLCTVGIAWFWLAGTVLIAQMYFFSQEVLGGANDVFSYIAAVAVGGLALGSITTQPLLRGEVNTKYAPLSTVFVALFLVDLALAVSGIKLFDSKISLSYFLSNYGIRITIDVFFAAFFAGIFLIPLQAMVQKTAYSKVRARMVAVCELAGTASIVLGVLLSLFFAKAGFGSVFALIALAGANIVFALAITLLLPRHIIMSVASAVFRFIFNVELKGLDYLKDAKQNAVIVASLNSMLDAVLLAVFLPGRVYFAVDSRWAQKFWVKPFLSLIHYYAIDPQNPMAIKTIIDGVKHGQKVVIFPEGRVSTTGGIMKVHQGLALVADRSGADIIPVYVEGSQFSIFSRIDKNMKNKASSRITINVLPPRKLGVPENLKGVERRQVSENKVYDIMAVMRYRSRNIDQTVIGALFSLRYKLGYRFKFVQDMSMKELSLGTLITAAFVLGKKMAKKTKRGDFVGVLLPSSNACVVAFFGLHLFNRAPAMINFSTGTKNVIASCKTAGIKTIFSSHQFIEKAALQDMVKALEEAGVGVVRLEDFKVSKLNKIEGLLRSFAPYTSYKITAGKTTADDPGILLFTSGSEGSPKGVVLTHKNLISNAAQIGAIVPHTTQDVVFSPMPFFHAFGVEGGLMCPLILGFKTFLYPSPLHYHIVPELVYQSNATIFFSTDTFLAGYAKVAHPYDFYSVRMIVIGAEKLREETLNIWARKFGIRVFEVYGATEASPGIAFSTPMHYKFGSVGRMLPDLQHRMEKVDGLDHGGNLYLKGDNIMKGYLKDDAPGVLQPPADGWYNTGDIVDIDSEGFVYIKGRVKRFAKVAGEMVPLLAVEEEISLLWPENKSAVVSIPDEKRGEALVLFTTQQGATRAEISQAFKNRGFTDLYVPRIINIIQELPLLGSGKVDYPLLTQMAKEQIAAKQETQD